MYEMNFHWQDQKKNKLTQFFWLTVSLILLSASCDYSTDDWRETRRPEMVEPEVVISGSLRD